MALKDTMQALLDCAQQALIDAGRPAESVVRLEPGAEAVWDECCEGYLYVQVRTLTPKEPQGNCGVTLFTASLFVGILRCAATLNDNMQYPAATVLSAEASTIADDAETILNAINCCFGQDRSVRVPVWNALSQGDCNGGEWQVDVGSTVPCGCPDG